MNGKAPRKSRTSASDRARLLASKAKPEPSLAQMLRLAAERSAEGQHHSARVMAVAAALGWNVDQEEWRHALIPMIEAVMPALRERVRQQFEKRYTAEADAAFHVQGELANAAALLLVDPRTRSEPICRMHDVPTVGSLLELVTFKISPHYRAPHYPETLGADAIKARMRDIDKAIALALAELQRLRAALDNLDAKSDPA